jgi:TRAP-type C4-dicarboxylate transport system permease small subunit
MGTLSYGDKKEPFSNRDWSRGNLNMSVNTTPSQPQSGVVHYLSKGVETIASVAIVIMVSLVVLEVLLRSTIGFSFGFVDELVSYLVVIVTFFGVCITFRNKALFRVEMFYGRLSQRSRRVLDTIHAVLSLVLCFTLIYYAFFLISSSFSRGTVSQSKLETPLYIPQLIIPTGLIILAIFILDFARSRFCTSKSHQIIKGEE